MAGTRRVPASFSLNSRTPEPAMTDLVPSPADPMPATAARPEPKDLPNSDADREASEEERNSPLFPTHQCATLEREWQVIQAKFVDAPRDCVQQADALVTKTIDILSSSFGEMRSSMERTWEKEGDVSTEELRLALQNYRSFFRRLLSI
jgi:hypothetical protein